MLLPVFRTYQFDVHFRFLRAECFFQFYPNFNILLENSGDPAQIPRSVVSDVGLPYLHMFHKKDPKLI